MTTSDSEMTSQRGRQRVVVTGIGLVTPFAATREPSWNALKSGGSATRWLDADELKLPRDPGRNDAAQQPFAGAPASRLIEPVTIGDRQFDEPVVALALQAAGEALGDAGIELSGEDRTRCGCVIGTSKGGMHSLWREFAGHSSSTASMSRLAETVWPQLPANIPSLAVAARHRLVGPLLCPVAACATGLLSLNRGCELVRDGQCDVVLAGSSDASLTPSVLASFRRLGVLAREFDDPSTACRPFDRARSGFVVGEGAAVLVFERLERALERGVLPYAEWVAAGCAADVGGITGLEEEPHSLIRLIRDVLRRAALTSAEIDYVNLHGTATRQNDLYETRALKAACGPSARLLCCSSLKGGAGHLLGAAGSVEMAATLLAMRDGVIPPTVNLHEPDVECDLDYTPLTPKPRRIENALKLSLGFGGHLVAAVVRSVAPNS